MIHLKEVTIYEPTTNRAESIGEGTKIGAFCDIGSGVVIGRNCNIQCHVSIPNDVRIGNGVFIGPGVRIFNDRYMNGLIQPPEIGDKCRIGGSTRILPGVKVGVNCFIWAGSMITKDVPDGMEVKGKW